MITDKLWHTHSESRMLMHYTRISKIQARAACSCYVEYPAFPQGDWIYSSRPAKAVIFAARQVFLVICNRVRDARSGSTGQPALDVIRSFHWLARMSTPVILSKKKYKAKNLWARLLHICPWVEMLSSASRIAVRPAVAPLRYYWASCLNARSKSELTWLLL